MASPGKAPCDVVEIQISCQHQPCQQKQTVQVRASKPSSFAQVKRQTVACVKCGRSIDLDLPDEIVGGPFLP